MAWLGMALFGALHFVVTGEMWAGTAAFCALYCAAMDYRERHGRVTMTSDRAALPLRCEVAP
ncbi:hypothetical protein UFOVP78_47 [uncultured Caudovirales phage]|uniref:Uncharacterized protein n=1 Tax=uncultured Caudovirales phage TaxID=2100421 RepID=A0A6J5L5B5_9CAUD|nr:hypothetical protein UFOVP78_47 [uncultured Caudovirales phage]